MSQTSTLRVLVDRALDERDTTFAEFLKAHSDGQPLYEVHLALVAETGIPVPQRTFYRWANKVEVST